MEILKSKKLNLTETKMIIKDNPEILKELNIDNYQLISLENKELLKVIQFKKLNKGVALNLKLTITC